ncbi:hypothetical protein HZA97_01860 [Candidatus Woesearchaeota archaeon]|nr:hypothetical protein [Candidatus Woesearchaeota archaeon]
MNKKLKKWSKRILCSFFATCLAISVGVQCYVSPTIPKVEESVKVVQELNKEIKNHKPKNILYLSSLDFSRKYSDSCDEVKTKLEGLLTTFGPYLSFDEVENLRKEISEMNILNETDFNNAFSALNLSKAEDPDSDKKGVEYLVRAPVKEARVDLESFSDQEKFFEMLAKEDTEKLDEIIIFAHGLRYNIECAENTLFSSINPSKNISVRDIVYFPEDEVQKIRSKLNSDAVIYLISCETLQNYENQTTIAEALAYLFQRPVIASTSDVLGWPVSIDLKLKSDKEFSFEALKKAITNCEARYDNNFGHGNWHVVLPK